MTDIISMGFLDDAGKRRTLPLTVPSGYTDAQLQTFIDGYIGAMDDVTDCQIVDVSVSKSFTLPGGIKSSPVAASEVRQGALLGFTCADTNYRASFFVPGWKQAGLTGDVVLTSGVYGTFQDFFSQGNGTVLPSDQYENDITSFISGVETFRKL